MVDFWRESLSCLPKKKKVNKKKLGWFYRKVWLRLDFFSNAIKSLTCNFKVKHVMILLKKIIFIDRGFAKRPLIGYKYNFIIRTSE